jgi:hypothetical protein
MLNADRDACTRHTETASPSNAHTMAIRQGTGAGEDERVDGDQDERGERVAPFLQPLAAGFDSRRWQPRA